MIHLLVDGLNEYLLGSDALPLPTNKNTDIVISIAHNDARVDYTYTIQHIDTDKQRIHIKHKSTNVRTKGDRDER